jgi:hypothetical protein
MNQATQEILLNREVIAVNQDPLGKQAKRIGSGGHLEVWNKPLSQGQLAAGLLNRGAAPAEITATWDALRIQGKWKARDLWAAKEHPPSDRWVRHGMIPGDEHRRSASEVAERRLRCRMKDLTRGGGLPGRGASVDDSSNR